MNTIAVINYRYCGQTQCTLRELSNPQKYGPGFKAKNRKSATYLGCFLYITAKSNLYTFNIR